MAAIASRGRGRRTINEINMVPFIDVMLVLLIIFMVTAPMLTPGVINTPSVGRADKTPAKFVNVTITKDGEVQIKLDGDTRTATAKEIAVLALRWQESQTEESAVLISADKSVTYETVVKTMSALQTAGLKRVALKVNLSGSK